MIEDDFVVVDEPIKDELIEELRDLAKKRPELEDEIWARINRIIERRNASRASKIAWMETIIQRVGADTRIAIVGNQHFLDRHAHEIRRAGMAVELAKESVLKEIKKFQLIAPEMTQENFMKHYLPKPKWNDKPDWTPGGEAPMKHRRKNRGR